MKSLKYYESKINDGNASRVYDAFRKRFNIPLIKGTDEVTGLHTKRFAMNVLNEAVRGATHPINNQTLALTSDYQMLLGSKCIYVTINKNCYATPLTGEEAKHLINQYLPDNEKEELK